MMSDFSDLDNSDFEVDSLDENFSQAAEQVQRIHDRLESSELLELYGLYKQAVVGQCNTSQPGIFSIQSRAKWQAWHRLHDMTKSEAKRLYIEKVHKLDANWSKAVKNGAQFKAPTSWVVHSIEQIPAEHLIAKADNEKNAFDYVKEGNLQRLKEVLLQSELLSELDEHGMGLIHWAADRNHVNILDFLLTSGVNINLLDADKQTALHYAASCGHLNCVRLLLRFNADRSLRDCNNETCSDVAEDLTVKELLNS